MAEHIIEIRNLTKHYGGQRGIENVSFHVEEGEIFGFIGPNGAGKSTTIRTLLALIYPTSGSADIFGRDCIRYAPEIARDIGYLPSEVFYYDGMKVRDLLNYSASFYKKDCRRRMKELTDCLELDVNRRIEDLSFGNKKKVGIVQGLLHEPRLIILDEPTSGLDPLMQQNFFALLKEENKKGATIFFSSHILSEIQKMCSRVGIMKAGKLLKLQKISELQENSFKKCHLIVKEPVSGELFQSAGVVDFTAEGNAVKFLYRGDINRIIARLHEVPLLDVTIEEPTLEEIFIHYYEEERL